MEAILVLSILMLFMSTGLFIQSIVALADEKYRWIFPCIASSLFIAGTFACMILSSNYTMLPHEKDVIERKAYYQEHFTIVDGDTIKTYEIKWFDNKRN